MLIQADHFAQRVWKEAGNSPAEQVKTMYRIAFSRDPNQKELDSNLAFLSKQREHEMASAPGASADKAALDALTDLAHVTLNLNEFAYIQ
jgi:hypothetical protein